MDLQLYVLKRDLKVVWNVYENMRKNEERVEYGVKNLNRFTKINLFRLDYQLIENKKTIPNRFKRDCNTV